MPVVSSLLTVCVAITKYPQLGKCKEWSIHITVLEVQEHITSILSAPGRAPKGLHHTVSGEESLGGATRCILLDFPYRGAVILLKGLV